MGYSECKILNFLKKDCIIYQTSEKIDITLFENNKFDFLISYGYRFMIPKNILDLFYLSAINLHISYLPFNKGSDPNFWSFVENSKKGVSIHYLNEKLDEGDIIIQKELFFDIKKHSFSSSYKILQDEIQDLFIRNWDQIKNKTCSKFKQNGTGSYHKSKDKDKYLKFLTNSWDSNIYEFLKNLKNS